MNIYDDLTTAVTQLIAEEEYDRGYLGYTIDGTFMVQVPDKPLYCYVHFPDRAYVQALNLGKVPPTPNLPVLIGYQGTGVERSAIIIGADPSTIVEFANGGTNVAVGEHTHDIPPMLDPVSSYRFKPGLLRNSEGMTLHVEPFLYIYNGVETYFEGRDIDVTDYRPASGMAWVKIWLDVDDGQLIAVTGNSYTNRPPYTALLSLEKPADTGVAIPIGGVILTSTQTIAPTWDMFGDARVFLNTDYDAALPLDNVNDDVGEFVVPVLTVDEKGRITAIRAALGSELPAHTHTTGDITGFSEAVDDRVAALLVAGTDVTLTYDDTANTLTIASTASGGGVHDHTASSITDFDTSVDARITAASLAPLVHGHVVADVSNFTESVQDTVSTLIVAGSNISKSYNDTTGELTISSSLPSHTHPSSDITNFNTSVDSRITAANLAPASHAHASSEITDFTEGVQDVVGSFVTAGSNVTVTYNDAGNALTIASSLPSHTHASSAITDFSTAADARITAANLAPASHTHTASAITDFSTAADARITAANLAPASHTHTASAITDFNTAADARITAANLAPASHTHASTAITDFTEAVQDTVGAFVTAGTNISVTYNDAANSLTIANTASSLPVGVVTMYPLATAPSGWLVCDGTAVSRTTYAALFAVIGTNFGTGDGSTTFNLPDMIWRFPAGSKTASGAGGAGMDKNIGTKWGVSQVTLDSTQMPPHTHTVSSFSTSTPGGAVSGTGRYITGTTSINSGSAGGSGGAAQPVNIIPPAFAINFIIYAGT